MLLEWIASKRTAAWCLWFFEWAVLIFTWMYPVSTTWSRALFVLAIAALYFTSLLLALRHAVGRRLLLGLLAVSMLFLCLPGRSYARDVLRQSMARCMIAYQGTRYCWGGESRFGIDCSGLVRRGLIEADLEQGLLTANPRLLRQGIFLWWHDCSARQLGDGYMSFTRPLFTIPSINQTDPARFLPGDLAVTPDGSHVMAYLGDSQWIEAHPDPGKVIVVKVPSSDNPRFQIPVKVVRWKQIEPAVR
jgi:hypothetical protein